MDSVTINYVVNETYRIATRAAMDGKPLGGVGWIPPQSATSPPTGTFIIIPLSTKLTAADKMPWDYM